MNLIIPMDLVQVHQVVVIEDIQAQVVVQAPLVMAVALEVVVLVASTNYANYF